MSEVLETDLYISPDFHEEPATVGSPDNAFISTQAEYSQRSSRAKTSSGSENLDPVKVYLDQIAEYPLLTKDDEVRLAQTIELGKAAEIELASSDSLSDYRKRQLRQQIIIGQDARQQFINSNLRLVVSIAKRYRHSSGGNPLLDRIQDGNSGLMHAVEKFDWRKGFKFSTYATNWIIQAVQRGISNDSRTIRLPVHAGDNLKHIREAAEKLEQQLGRRPTIEEIALTVDMPASKVADIFPYMTGLSSLDEEITDRHSPRQNFIRDKLANTEADALLAIELAEIRDLMYLTLNNDELRVMSAYCGFDDEPLNKSQVAAKLGIPQYEVNKIFDIAISKLRPLLT